ncbi:MAG: protein translocase subunit SecD [Bythopirellula sp.]|nr:protein translocase subunit SecD [Bythopirellula sp.]
MSWLLVQRFALLAVVVLLGMTAGRVMAQETTGDKPADTATTEIGVAGNATPAAPSEATSAIPGLVALSMVIAVFVIPIVIGSYLAKIWRMPEHGWKFAVAIGSILAAALVLYQGELKYGPDLSGGITLIYELQNTSAAAKADDTSQGTSGGQSVSEKSQLVRQLISALGERIDPSGTKEVSIREYGPDQIEIIIPKASQEELDFIERRIYTAGALEFRITAAPGFSENTEIIELAKALPPSINEVMMGGRKVAEWMPYKMEEFGPADQPDERVVKRMAGKEPQALILMNDGLDVTGSYLSQSSSGFDETGQPQVNFVFNDLGAFRFGQLTSEHLPNPSGQKYSLGIILDKKLLTAPSINSKITSQGRITGNNSKEEVDFIVGILNAGSLPASLDKDPISRATISPTLGAETVERGKIAIAFCLLISIGFMIFYYRFAGLVACVALCTNLLLTLGVMVLFHAAFTLPGLAGLVLSVGMSVDANVLIFERIREERARGAALRMAIRNGYDRAFTTIIDSNMCNLITAVVIYRIAPDNVKGFGVTLIIGIIMSMFAAVFLTRIIFDVAEKLGKVKDLKMSQVIGETHFDFMGKRHLAIGASWLLIAIGVFAMFQRGEDLLNIDFTGGSSVTMVLKDKDNMTFSEVMDVLAETDLKDKNLSLVEVDEGGTRFTVSSIEQDVEAVQKILQEKFGDKLQTYQVEVTNVGPIGEQTGSIPSRRQIAARLVNFQAEEATEEAVEEKTDAPTEETPAAEQPATTSEADTGEATEAAATPVTKEIDFFVGGTKAQLLFGDKGDADGGVNIETAEHMLRQALEASGRGSARFELSNPDFTKGTARRFNTWDVKLAVPPAEAAGVFAELEKATNSEPVFPLANKIGGRVADDLRTKAIASVIVSFIGIIAYIWFRFHGWIYGVAAVIAIIHDVLITVGMIAMSSWLVQSIPGLAQALMIEKFQISLPVVASLLTIIGYSLNDTIVVFDRIREVKGKSPRLTGDMINLSVNQTLSRTLLTSLTTIFSVLVLYIMGGEGIHGFTFALVIGIVVGTYSSVFIASPILLWLSHGEQATAAKPTTTGAAGTRDLAAAK